MSSLIPYLKLRSQPQRAYFLCISLLNLRTPYFTDHYINGRHGGGEFQQSRIYYMDPQKRFVQCHAYSITAVDSQSRTLRIVNPHDTAKLQYTLTFDDFFKFFGAVEVTSLNIPAIKRDFGNIRTK